MSDWTYGPAGFQPLEVAWADLDDHEECLGVLGYGMQAMHFGALDGMSAGVEVEVRERMREDAPGAYLVSVELGSTIENIHVSDFPGLLRFLRELAPLLQLTFESKDQDALREHLSNCAQRPSGSGYCHYCRQEKALAGRDPSTC